jgi:YD repeat-containing protein
MAVGFFEEHRNGYRIIGHGGDLTRFHSHMSLLLDEGVGLFLSVNSAGSGGGVYGLREAVRDAFLARYFPRREPVEPVVKAEDELPKVTGPYILSRRGETTLFRVASLAIPIAVEANPDGSIQVPLLTGANGRPIRWYPIGDLVYRTEDGGERLGFVRDSSGNVVRVAFLGGHEFHRVGTGDNVIRNYWLVGTSLAVMLVTVVLWPLAGYIRRRYRQRVPDDGVSPRLRGLTRVIALLNLAFIATFALIFTMAVSEKLKLDPTLDPYVRGSQLLGVLGLFGTVAVAVACVQSFTRGNNNLARLKYLALTLACLAFGWFALHWNLLVWNLDF